MNFRDAPAVEEAVYQMRLIELERSRNRARINQLFNGWPPFSEDEQRQNQAEGDTNVNFLSGTHINMGARGQYQNALIAPNPLVDVSVDYGKPYQSQQISLTVAKQFNRILKGSLPFAEEERSTFAQLTLHGIGPAVWDNHYRVVPAARGIEDILIPSETLRDCTNLPFFSVFRRYTAGEMQEVLRGPHCDPAWNKPLIRRLIKWVSEQAIGLLGNRWPDWLKPESLGELAKENSGLFWSDNVPTIDTYDFYYYDDDGRRSGWKRRMILDVWGQPGSGGYSGKAPRADDKFTNKYANSKHIDEGDTRAFMYNSGDRIYASDISEIVHFQYGDVSAVAPFRYHTVRGLGFLMYALCHLENRFSCRVMDHAFESLLQYFRVANPADEQRVLNIDLINKGVLPDGITMVGQNERWQVQDRFLAQAEGMLRQRMTDNSSSFMQGGGEAAREKPNETATAVMARVNATAQLVGFVLSSAYDYQKFKYTEIARRLCIPDSRDIQAKKFRVRCLRAGVPEKAFDIDRWEVEAVRVSGNGNRMLQIAIAEKLLAVRPLHGPEAQAEILRMYDTNVSGDPDLGNRLNPQTPRISDTVKLAQTDTAILMQGLPASAQSGINEAEYIGAMLVSLGTKIKQLQANGSVASGPEIVGLNAVAQAVGQHLKTLSADPSSKPQVKQFSDALGKLANYIKAFAQRLQEQQKAGSPQLDPETAAKIQAIVIQAQTKSKLAEKSHAEKTAQRQISFEQKLKQDADKHTHEMIKKTTEPARANFFPE
jgi:hypothetical protein